MRLSSNDLLNSDKAFKNNLVLLARGYALEKHKEQFRDDGVTPYTFHLAQVVEILSKVTKDPEILAAGWLHDTIEDTATGYDDLLLKFGKRIADLVLEVTHDPRVPGKPKTFSRLKTPEGIMIKFADRLSNLSDMQVWNEKRQATYLEKSKFWNS